MNVIVEIGTLSAANAVYSYNTMQLLAFRRLQVSIPRLVVRLAGVRTVHESCLVPVTTPFDNMTDKGLSRRNTED